MFVSKFWIILLAAVSGLLLAVILLARDTVNRERLENKKEILYKELTKADIALRLHARKRLDILLSIAVDPKIRKMISHISSSGKSKDETAREKLLTTLRNHNKGLGKYRADILFLLDTKGDVVVQVGENERKFGYSMSGFPIVNDALRGRIRDDVWKIEQNIYLMGARPLIDQGRYVGALLHGMKITDNLASLLSPTIQMAFYADKVMLAVGTPSSKDIAKVQGAFIGDKLDKILVDSHYKEKGYSKPVTIKSKEGNYLAVYSSIKGAASENGVGFALVTDLTTMNSPAEFYKNAAKQDLDALPLVYIILSVLILAGLGWLFNYLEIQRPIRKLCNHIVETQKKDPKDQLNVYMFRRNVRKIASEINALMDMKLKSLMEMSGDGHKSIDSILGSVGNKRLSSASFKFVEPAGDDIPPPPPPTGNNKALTPSGGGSLKKPVVTGKQHKLTPSKPQAPVTPSADTKSNAKLTSEEENTYFKKIFDEFAKKKKELGENTTALTFERFLVTLKKNRDALMARYKCNRVNFKVYVKDGKVSLKATPDKSS